MASAISLYIYRIKIFEVNGRRQLDFDDSRLNETMFDFLKNFVSKYEVIKEDHERQRTWFFDPPKAINDAEIHGYIRYGTFGFESELFDTKSKKKQYDRKATDFEQIELYYQFWLPDGENYGLIAFQTFSGRSCISYVREALNDYFKSTNAGLALRSDKIAPQNVARASFADAVVKQVRMIKRSSSNDLANLHGASKRPSEVEIEVKVTARNGSFGKFGALDPKLLRANAGVFSIGSGPFEKATAAVELNGKLRHIGVFGDSGNVGAFDVTEDVTFGSNGHPTFDSIDQIADDILSDVYGSI